MGESPEVPIMAESKTCGCGNEIGPNDIAAETLGGIVCRRCALDGGIDVAAFGQPLKEI